MLEVQIEGATLILVRLPLFYKTFEVFNLLKSINVMFIIDTPLEQDITSAFQF